MMKIFAVILFIVAVVAFLIWQGQSNWIEYVSAKAERIRTAASQNVTYVNFDELNKLPKPVKRYFHLVLKDGAPIINRCFVSQLGGFKAKPEMKGWSKMEAKQYFSSKPRSFVWDSFITIVPGLSIRVCDSYTEGKGEIKGKFLSLFTLIDEKNKKELNEAALQRYLAEAVWFPTALLPSQGVTWVALDNYKAKAEINDSGITTSLDFEFNEKGEIVSVYTPSRYREVSGKYIPTPWKGNYSKYVNYNAYLIPQLGQVEWHLGEQVYSYWKANLVEVRYD